MAPPPSRWPLKFLLAALGALVAAAVIVALGVLCHLLMRSPDSGPFDAATTVVIVLYLLFPLFAAAAIAITLDLYSHVTPTIQRDAADAVDALFSS